MKRALPVALAILAPLLAHTAARAQPQQAPIVATPLPLLPPPERHPPAGQPQMVQPQYQSPQYQSPQYQPPQGQPPQYQQPQFQPPQYQQPQYQPSQGQQPQFQQPQGQPPQVQQQPLPVAPAPGQPSAQGQPAAPEQPAPPPPSNPWLPQGSAVLRMLDKVNAQITTQTVKVGQTVTYESLSIAVQACMVRPPDMPQDAAAFLTITDSHPDQPGFKGWMLKSDPSLAMLEHPLYDVRVVGCTP